MVFFLDQSAAPRLPGTYKFVCHLTTSSHRACVLQVSNAAAELRAALHAEQSAKAALQQDCDALSSELESSMSTTGILILSGPKMMLSSHATYQQGTLHVHVSLVGSYRHRVSSAYSLIILRLTDVFTPCAH